MLDSFTQSLRRHKTAIALAILTSLIVAAPQVYFRIQHAHDGVYQGIELLPDAPRSALTREIQDGHLNLGNVYYKDGKDDPYLWQPLQPMAVAFLGELFGLDINNTLLLSRLVLPFFAFLLLYGFVLLLSRDRLTALTSASLLLLADLLLSFSGLSQLLHGIGASTFIQLSRPVDPVMTYIPFFGFLIAFWLYYQKRDYRWGIASAVILGLNFYTYFYTWTYLYAFGGLLVLVYLLQKKWREVARLGSVFLGALVIAIPYFINMYRASLYPTYADASARFGVVATHAPLSVGVLAIVALGIFFLWFPREDRERYFFGLALLLTPFITMNQQIITGKVMQPDHYHWFFQKPIAIIVILTALFYLLSRRNFDFYKKALAVCIITASVTAGAFAQATAYFHDSRDGGTVAIDRQRFGPVMAWLSVHAEKESVVLANDEISHVTVIYTPLNVFYHRVVGNSLAATKERLIDVLSVFYRLRGVGTKDARETFFAERGYISWNVYGIYYREAFDSYEAIPDATIEEILALYQKSLATPTSEWLKQKMAQYDVNYIVWDKKIDPEWQLQKYLFLKERAVFGNIAIYQTDF